MASTCQLTHQNKKKKKEKKKKESIVKKKKNFEILFQILLAGK